MPDPAYRAAPPAAMRVEPLGELTAIFDRRSMQTHLVVSPMPEILEAMGAGDCDAATLAARLAESFDFDGMDNVQLVLSERLSELVAMGLVARA